MIEVIEVTTFYSNQPVTLSVEYSSILNANGEKANNIINKLMTVLEVPRLRSNLFPSSTEGRQKNSSSLKQKKQKYFGNKNRRS